MGTKPSNIYQMDRPESGGADHDEAREASGLLERDKQEFAASQKAKRDGSVRQAERQAAPQADGAPNGAPRARTKKMKRARASGRGKPGRR